MFGASKALADPIIGLFDTQASTQTVKANLPCSVKLVDQSFVLGSPNCVINQLDPGPPRDQRNVPVTGSGTASNLRVFVKELQVELILPGICFILDASGTTVVSGAATVNTALSSDNFLTATLPDCSSLQVGYNSTYAGAYIDTAAATYTTTGMCGDCDNTNDKNAGSTNVTNFAYFLKFLVPTADQKGSYASECGQLETIITSTCSVAELDLVAEVCLPYMSDFGLCLIDDASVPSVPDFSTLFNNKFIPCVSSICTTEAVTTMCTILTADQNMNCTVNPFPASCT
ncbi:hypothetical protein ACOMHN_045799 [Nucella lapillus]